MSTSLKAFAQFVPYFVFVWQVYYLSFVLFCEDRPCSQDSFKDTIMFKVLILLQTPYPIIDRIGKELLELPEVQKSLPVNQPDAPK